MKTSKIRFLRLFVITRLAFVCLLFPIVTTSCWQRNSNRSVIIDLDALDGYPALLENSAPFRPPEAPLFIFSCSSNTLVRTLYRAMEQASCLGTDSFSIRNQDDDFFPISFGPLGLYQPLQGEFPALVDVVDIDEIGVKHNTQRRIDHAQNDVSTGEEKPIAVEVYWSGSAKCQSLFEVAKLYSSMTTNAVVLVHGPYDLWFPAGQ